MTRAERRTYWQEHVTAWQAGSESQAAYCRRLGLSAMSFSQWKRRFEREQISAVVPEAGERAALVEVQLADEHTQASAGITVELGGVHLRLAREFDAEALQRAVSALRDAGH